jgi:hypothetical protein
MKKESKSVKIPAPAHATLSEFAARFGIAKERLLEMAVNEFAEKHGKSTTLCVTRVDDCSKGAA